MDDLRLSQFVLVEEGLEAVKDGTAQNKGLLLVYHGHEEDNDGRSVKEKIVCYGLLIKLLFWVSFSISLHAILRLLRHVVV